jgi:hypothetical protein
VPLETVSPPVRFGKEMAAFGRLTYSQNVFSGGVLFFLSGWKAKIIVAVGKIAVLAGGYLFTVPDNRHRYQVRKGCSRVWR